MSAEENKAIVRRLYEEALNKGELAIADESIANNYVYHSPVGEFKGPEGFKQLINMYRTAFPDINVIVDDIVAEGDKVASRVTLRGTHKGDFMGIAATGKQLTFTGAIFSRFEGGKEVDALPFVDMLTVYQQMGVSPPGQ